MPLTNFKSDLTSYLKKLAGVHAVGELWWHYDPKSKPAGVQLFSGQLLSREAYIDHWTLVSIKRTVVTEEEWQVMVAEQGFCQFYSSGDGSTTYRMPLVKGVHPKFVAALSEAGQYKEAGAPNITGGGVGNVIVGTTSAVSNGALSTPGASLNKQIPAGGSVGYCSIDVDASLCSPVYRDDCDTIQPPALTTLLGEYVVGSVSALGDADAESLLASMTMLESNVGAMSNGVGFSTAGKSEIVGWGMPDYTAGVSMTNKLDFVVPCDGVVLVNGYNNQSTRSYYKINGTVVAQSLYASPATTAMNFTIPACKGDVHRIECSGALYDSTKFYPLQGA